MFFDTITVEFTYASAASSHFTPWHHWRNSSLTS